MTDGKDWDSSGSKRSRTLLLLDFMREGRATVQILERTLTSQHVKMGEDGKRGEEIPERGNGRALVWVMTEFL